MLLAALGMPSKSRRCHFAHHHPSCVCQRHNLSAELEGLAESLKHFHVARAFKRRAWVSVSALALLGGCAHVWQDDHTSRRKRWNHQGYTSYRLVPDQRPFHSETYKAGRRLARTAAETPAPKEHVCGTWYAGDACVQELASR